MFQEHLHKNNILNTVKLLGEIKSIMVIKINKKGALDGPDMIVCYELRRTGIAPGEQG